MIRTDKRLRLCLTLLVLNLVVIWGNSLLPGEVSSAFSGWVMDMLTQIVPFAPGGSGGHGLLRKLGHFTEFCLLGMCLMWLFGMLKKKPWVSLASGFCAACIDEIIQRFVPDRGPSIMDVGIDTAGVTLGIILLLTGHAIYKMKNKKLEEM